MGDEGKMINIGMSNHVHFEVAYKLIDTGRPDKVLLAKRYLPRRC